MASLCMILLCIYSLIQSNLLSAALLSYFSSILPTKVGKYVFEYFLEKQMAIVYDAVSDVESGGQ